MSRCHFCSLQKDHGPNLTKFSMGDISTLQTFQTEHATQIISILHKHVLNKLVKFKIEASELENKIEIYIKSY